MRFPPSAIAPKVHWIRHEKVLLDYDLAALYGVTTFNLNKAVKRNSDRFPADFMFQLTAAEAENLRFHLGISSSGHGGRRYLPYAFTEQGVAMLSSVLRSTRAVQVNLAIMRTFVQLRRLMDSNRDLARRIDTLEKKYDEQFRVVFDAIKRLIAEDKVRKSRPRRDCLKIWQLKCCFSPRAINPGMAARSPAGWHLAMLTGGYLLISAQAPLHAWRNLATHDQTFNG